jgi:hypothetical protein
MSRWGVGPHVAVVALALLVTGVVPVAAQGIQFGGKGGVNFANLRFDEAIDLSFDDRIGLIAGGFVTIPLGDRFGIQPEVLFSQKGAQFDELGATGRVELDFLDVPILARYRFGRLFLFGGPSFGLKLRAREVTEFGDDQEEVDLADDVESFDFGIVAGAGYEFGRFSVDGRYTWGLSNINAVDSDEVEIKTRVYAVLAGFRF